MRRGRHLRKHHGQLLQSWFWCDFTQNSFFKERNFDCLIRFRIETVARTKLRRMRHNHNKVSGKKSKMFKMSSELREEWRRNKRPNLVMELGDDCCTDHFNTVALSRHTSNGDGNNNEDRFLVMGVHRNGQLVPTLVLPWTKKSKVIIILYSLVLSEGNSFLISIEGHPQCC